MNHSPAIVSTDSANGVHEYASSLSHELSGMAAGDLLSGARPLRNLRLPISYRGISTFAMAFDLILIVLAAVFAQIVYHHFVFGTPDEVSRELAASSFVAVLFISSIRMRNLYDPSRLLIWTEQLRCVLWAWCGAFLILACGVFAGGVGSGISRGDIFLLYAVGGVALIAHRLAWRFLLPEALDTGALRRRNVLLITCGDQVHVDFQQILLRHGYSVSASFEINPLSGKREDVKGVIENVIAAARASDIHEVFILSDADSVNRVGSIMEGLRSLPLPISMVPSGELAEIVRQSSYRLGPAVAVELQRSPLSLFERGLKRSVDICCAILGIILLCPLFLIIAIAIRIDTPGAVLFRQTRHGFSGRPFRIIKFRTMIVLEDGEVVRQATRGDSRVTRVGRWLRRFSLDELPQLLNVLSGEMSMVGPRPHASAHESFFSTSIEKYCLRHHLKAGLTGWAQVRGARGATDSLEKMQRRVDLDVWYISNWSIWLDFSIMLRTLGVIILGENAH
jgi:putative colanic acid biosynthesis UDP-glucose lipid carrier transferase